MSVTTISNSSGLSVSVTSVGASVTEIKLPDGTDVVLGYKDLEVYKTNPFYLGCSVGRVTNRTAGAQFTLDGETYKLTANAGDNHLHGGIDGFNKAEWKLESRTETSITYKHTSPDGDQGYPGTLTAHARYSLCGSNDVLVEYWAETTASTPVNMTNHSYFNLAGKGTIEDHILTLNADTYTPLDPKDLTATGEIARLTDPIDFQKPRRVGEKMSQVGERGYDHNYCLKKTPLLDGDKDLHWAATLKDPNSPRSLQIFTDQPCVQLYVGGYLDGVTLGKDNLPIQPHAGLCLETQHHPNAANEPAFPSIILKPGDKYISKTLWKWSW